MTSITRTVEIGTDHKLHLDVDLPSDLPQGKARIVLTVLPIAEPKNEATVNRLGSLFGKGKGKVRMSDDFDAPLAEFEEYS